MGGNGNQTRQKVTDNFDKKVAVPASSPLICSLCLNKKEKFMESEFEIKMLKTDAHYYEMLKQQIAIYTGKRGGSLSALQSWYNRHYLEQKPTICQECNKIIETDGHSKVCQIVKDYGGYFDLSESV